MPPKKSTDDEKSTAEEGVNDRVLIRDLDGFVKKLRDAHQGKEREAIFSELMLQEANKLAKSAEVFQLYVLVAVQLDDSLGKKISGWKNNGTLLDLKPSKKLLGAHEQTTHLPLLKEGTGKDLYFRIRLAAQSTVIRWWTYTIFRFYNWHTKATSFLKSLRAFAIACNDWKEAAMILNVVVARRCTQGTAAWAHLQKPRIQAQDVDRATTEAKKLKGKVGKDHGKNFVFQLDQNGLVKEGSPIRKVSASATAAAPLPPPPPPPLDPASATKGKKGVEKPPPAQNKPGAASKAEKFPENRGGSRSIDPSAQDMGTTEQVDEEESVNQNKASDTTSLTTVSSGIDAGEGAQILMSLSQRRKRLSPDSAVSAQPAVPLTTVDHDAQPDEEVGESISPERDDSPSVRDSKKTPLSKVADVEATDSPEGVDITGPQTDLVDTALDSQQTPPPAAEEVAIPKERTGSVTPDSNRMSLLTPPLTGHGPTKKRSTEPESSARLSKRQRQISDVDMPTPESSPIAPSSSRRGDKASGLTARLKSQLQPQVARESAETLEGESGLSKSISQPTPAVESTEEADVARAKEADSSDSDAPSVPADSEDVVRPTTDQAEQQQRETSPHALDLIPTPIAEVAKTASAPHGASNPLDDPSQQLLTEQVDESPKSSNLIDWDKLTSSQETARLGTMTTSTLVKYLERLTEDLRQREKREGAASAPDRLSQEWLLEAQASLGAKTLIVRRRPVAELEGDALAEIADENVLFEGGHSKLCFEFGHEDTTA